MVAAEALDYIQNVLSVQRRHSKVANRRTSFWIWIRHQFHLLAMQGKPLKLWEGAQHIFKSYHHVTLSMPHLSVPCLWWLPRVKNARASFLKNGQQQQQIKYSGSPICQNPILSHHSKQTSHIALDLQEPPPVNNKCMADRLFPGKPTRLSHAYTLHLLLQTLWHLDPGDKPSWSSNY